MSPAGTAEVLWDEKKAAWVVRIQVGEEVVRRTCKNSKRELGDGELRTLAVQTAKDDGYEVPLESVTIKR